jgi:AcrR family transcriptional regulator
MMWATDLMSPKKQTDVRRADALRNRERILDAAERLLEQSPSAPLAEIAAAAGVARSTLHRRFASRDDLIAAVRERPRETGVERTAGALPTGRFGRERPVSLDAIRVFDVVPPAALAEQLVAEAQRIAKVPVALYVLDIDGSHLLHIGGASAGSWRLLWRSDRSSTPTACRSSASSSRASPLPTCMPCGSADARTE